MCKLDIRTLSASELPILSELHEDFQSRGLGKYLLENVINYLEEKGYSEFTIGVEDDNERAIHIYKKLGFDEIIARKREEYQGDAYEYNLYLRH